MITDPLFHALAIPAILITGVYIGLWMQHRVTDSTVYRWANVLLFATGCKLIWDGVSMLTAHGAPHGRRPPLSRGLGCLRQQAPDCA